MLLINSIGKQGMCLFYLEKALWGAIFMAHSFFFSDHTQMVLFIKAYHKISNIALKRKQGSHKITEVLLGSSKEVKYVIDKTGATSV